MADGREEEPRVEGRGNEVRRNEGEREGGREGGKEVPVLTSLAQPLRSMGRWEAGR